MIPRHVLLPLPERRAAEPLARAWLAAQWQRDATRLPLHRDPRGRPRLAAPMDDCDAGWSHSGGWLLLACGRGLRLGCDLERERPRPNARALARRFFHPAEADALDDGQAGKGKHPCPQSRIVALYHETLPELRQVREWNETRQRLLAKRWAENPERQTLDWWRAFFVYVRKSPFLMGQTQGRDGRPFDCDLEWLIRPTNFAKVVEGKYEGAPR